MVGKDALNLKKWMLALGIALLMLLPAAVLGETWQDAVATEPAGYRELTDGSVEIASAEGLAWFARQVNVQGNRFAGKTVCLTEDIDLQANEWVPIGRSPSGKGFFTGVFDGRGHTVSNLWQTETTEESGASLYAGLFGYAWQATIRDVKIKNTQLEFSGDKLVSAIYAGAAAGFANGCVLEDIETVNTAVTCKAVSTFYLHAGGLAGMADHAVNQAMLPERFTKIADCSVERLQIEYDGTTAENGAFAGGILGSQGSNLEQGTYQMFGAKQYAAGPGEISGCRVNDFQLVRESGCEHVLDSFGGIVGYADAALSLTDCTVEKLCADLSGSVAAANSPYHVSNVYGGGIAGTLFNGGLLRCYVCKSVITSDISSRTEHGFGMAYRSGMYGGLVGVLGLYDIQYGVYANYYGYGAQDETLRVKSCYTEMDFRLMQNEAARHVAGFTCLYQGDYWGSVPTETVCTIEYVISRCTGVTANSLVPQDEEKDGFVVAGLRPLDTGTLTIRQVHPAAAKTLYARRAEEPFDYHWLEATGATYLSLGQESMQCSDDIAQMTRSYYAAPSLLTAPDGGEKLSFSRAGLFPVSVVLTMPGDPEVKIRFGMDVNVLDDGSAAGMDGGSADGALPSLEEPLPAELPQTGGRDVRMWALLAAVSLAAALYCWKRLC